jgi:CheY-like chemotaxis protein
MSNPLILLVDDFADAREMYAEYLAFRGYRVAVAASGHAALSAALSADPPNLILMDLQMQGMTGTEAMRLLREHPELAGVPIVAFTAHALEGERLQALSDGFDGVIPKPCLPNDLVTLIDHYLTGRSEARG